MTEQPYLDRRLRLIEQHPDGLILVRAHGAEGVNPNFFYLTGITEQSAAVLLAAEGVRVGTGRRHPGRDYVRGRRVRQVLFLPPGNALAKRWGEDSAVTLDTVEAEALGFDTLVATGEWNDVLTAALKTAKSACLVRGFPASMSGADDDDTIFASRIRSRFVGVEMRDATPTVHEMRRIKDDREQGAISRSVGVTAEALDAVAAVLTPGVREHELEGEINRVYRAHGGTHAFDPIVGSGANALKLHYKQNTGPAEAGQLLLIDTGVSIDGYKSDITRTVPVSGTFSPRQREVYETVLRAQTEAIKLCRPGAFIGDIHARSFEVLAEAGFGGNEYPHGIGHYLGLETHDVGDVHAPLKPGAVLTIEPGIYIDEETIGIRIEDDVVVTEDGPRVLGDAIPRAPDEIERWLANARA